MRQILFGLAQLSEFLLYFMLLLGLGAVPMALVLVFGSYWWGLAYIPLLLLFAWILGDQYEEENPFN